MKHLYSLLALCCFSLVLLSHGTLFAVDEAVPGKEVPSLVAPGMPAKAPSHNDQGISLFDKGDYGAALLEFNRALAEDPTNVRLLINRGLAFAKRGQYKGAIENFYYALDYDKNNVSALKYLAATYFLNREYEKAIKPYDRAATLSSSDYDIYTKRGIASAALERHSAAIQDFTRTLSFTSKYVPAYIGRGISYTTKGNYAWAISDFDNALIISPSSPFVYLLRSEACAKSGNFSSALADLNKSCSLGYETVCEAVTQSKSDIENTEATFALQYSKKGEEEELYLASRQKLDSFFATTQSTEMKNIFDNDLRPLSLGNGSK
jgi:tetratricopeptide (TPR) repeat protein